MGAVPKSSTTLAMLDMLDNWTMATDGNRATVRIIMFDLRKAFEGIDHRILTDNSRSLNLPRKCCKWDNEFFSNQYERVKQGACCSGVWFPLASSRAQKLSPWPFILNVIDYLIVHGASPWKYVNDTTVSDVVEKGQISFTQELVNSVED